MEPSPYHIITSPQAEADLRSITSYLTREEPDRVDLVLGRIRQGIARIAVYPLGQRVIERRRDPELSVKRFVVWPYIIYFRVSERRHAVEVVMIRHGMRRQPKRFR
jgi:plasmid stabilization system protein ParE